MSEREKCKTKVTAAAANPKKPQTIKFMFKKLSNICQHLRYPILHVNWFTVFQESSASFS